MDADLRRAQDALNALYSGKPAARVPPPPRKPAPPAFGSKVSRAGATKASTAESLAREAVRTKADLDSAGAPWPGAQTDLRFAPSLRHPKVGGEEGNVARALARLAQKEVELNEARAKLLARERDLRYASGSAGRLAPATTVPEPGPG